MKNTTQHFMAFAYVLLVAFLSYQIFTLCKVSNVDFDSPQQSLTNRSETIHLFGFIALITVSYFTFLFVSKKSN